MEPRGGEQSGKREDAGQQPHGKVNLIAVPQETQGRCEPGWNDEGDESRGPRREDRHRAKHRATENEDEKNLVREIGFRVQEHACRAPTCSGQASAGSECSTPLTRLEAGGRGAPVPARQKKPRHRNQRHIQPPGEDDLAGRSVPLKTGQDGGGDKSSCNCEVCIAE